MSVKYIVLFLGMFAAISSTQAEEFVLVKNGVVQAPIILPENAPPVIRQAAEEFAGYVEKISGAKPKILQGLSDAIPPRAVWIGYQPRVLEIFSDIDFEFKHPEEILMAASADHLVIAGRDGPVVSVDGQDADLRMEFGTVNAVYTFLQEQLSVRWLWPGELGEDVPRSKTISIPAMTYRYHPQIRARSGLFNFSARGNRGYGRAQDWTRQQRLQLSSLELEGGHAFTDWWERFNESHREFFALQPDGTRSGFPNPRTVKLCQSNPAVWQQWLTD
ncbi:MAG: hypothetical protein WDZ51_03380, partial [Pirellulaceae bacterium]